MKLLNINYGRVSLIAALFAFSLLAFTPRLASAQILPPLGANGQTCSNNGQYMMLEWFGGSGPITCVPGFFGNAVNGAVTQNAAITMNNGLTVGGTSATLGNASSTVNFGGIASTSNLATACSGPGNVGVDMSGNLHCCPLGTAVTAATSTSVTCGFLN